MRLSRRANPLLLYGYLIIIRPFGTLLRSVCCACLPAKQQQRINKPYKRSLGAQDFVAAQVVLKNTVYTVDQTWSVESSSWLGSLGRVSWVNSLGAVSWQVPTVVRWSIRAAERRIQAREHEGRESSIRFSQR